MKASSSPTFLYTWLTKEVKVCIATAQHFWKKWWILQMLYAKTRRITGSPWVPYILYINYYLLFSERKFVQISSDLIQISDLKRKIWFMFVIWDSRFITSWFTSRHLENPSLCYNGETLKKNMKGFTIWHNVLKLQWW